MDPHSQAVERLAWLLEHRERIGVALLPPNTVQLDFRDLRTLDLSPEALGASLLLLERGWRETPCSVAEDLDGCRQVLATCQDGSGVGEEVRRTWIVFEGRRWFWPAVVSTLRYVSKPLRKALGGKLAARDPVGKAAPVLEALLVLGEDVDDLVPESLTRRAAFETALSEARARFEARARPAPREVPAVQLPLPTPAASEVDATVNEVDAPGHGPPPVPSSSGLDVAVLQAVSTLAQLVEGLPVALASAMRDPGASATHMPPVEGHMGDRQGHMPPDSDHMPPIVLSSFALPQKEAAAAAADVDNVLEWRKPARAAPVDDPRSADGSPSADGALALAEHPSPWDDSRAAGLREYLETLAPVVDLIWARGLSNLDRQTAELWHDRGIPARFAADVVISRCTTIGPDGQAQLFQPRAVRTGDPVQSLAFWRAAMVEEWQRQRELQAPAQSGGAMPEVDVGARLGALVDALPDALPERATWAARVCDLAELSSEVIEERLTEIDQALVDAVAGWLDDAQREDIETKLETSRRTMSGRLPPNALGPALRRLRDRLAREAAGLPVLSLFSPDAKP